MATAPTIIQIALSTPLRQVFDYLLPKNQDIKALHPGVRVLVPFGTRKLIGILLGTVSTASVPVAKLKPIVEIIDKQPILSPQLLKLYRFTSEYYHHALGTVILGTLPKLVRQGQEIMLTQARVYRINPAGQAALQTGLKRAKRQQALLQLLQTGAEGMNAATLKASGFEQALLNKLVAKNWIDEITTELPTATQQVIAHPSPLTLNSQQQAACDTICSTNEFHTFLLAGVTGSGKTEVYLRCIERVLTAGKSVLVLVPEIALTPQTIARFRQRFLVPIALFHSELTDKQKAQAWAEAYYGVAKIIIGTRSAVFAPLVKLGLIILDEEHDASFKQQSRFRYSARDVAVMRGRIENIPVILGSATPALESLHNVTRNRYQLLSLPHRAGNATVPKITIHDIRDKPLLGGVDKNLFGCIKQHLQQGGQVLLFLNRRGYAPVLLCHRCGWVAQCRHCDARLTLHQNPRRCYCHHCGTQHKVITICPQCQQNELIALGLGTEQIEQTLQSIFPEQDIVRIDRDSTRHKGSKNDLLQRIHSNQANLLVGTQMIAKGHHFPNLTLVIVIDADGGLFSADFRALERMGQLIMQVAGRAGREQRPGEVIVQTHHPEHPLLQCLVRDGYQAFAQALLHDRQAALLPPFSHLALLRVEAKDRAQPLHFLAELKQSLKRYKQIGIDVLGPVPAPMERKAGRYRAQLLLQAQRRAELHELLSSLVKQVTKTVSARVRWSIDIDPIDLL